jgi:hypothetical protein
MYWLEGSAPAEVGDGHAIVAWLRDVWRERLFSGCAIGWLKRCCWVNGAWKLGGVAMLMVKCPRGRLRREGDSDKTLQLTFPRPVACACLLVLRLLFA